MDDVLAVAGGIIIAFFVIWAVLAMLRGSLVNRIVQEEAHKQARSDERERLGKLANRLRETNPTLYADASARAWETTCLRSAEDPNEKSYALDSDGKVHACYPSEREKLGLRRHVPIFMADLGAAAEDICRERGLPPP
jgi:hypothetical protein